MKSDEFGDLCTLRTGEAHAKRVKTVDILNMYWKNQMEVAIIPLKTELVSLMYNSKYLNLYISPFQYFLRLYESKAIFA